MKNKFGSQNTLKKFGAINTTFDINKIKRNETSNELQEISDKADVQIDTLPVIEQVETIIYLPEIYKKQEIIVEKQSLDDKKQVKNHFADAVRMIILKKKHSGW